MYVESGGQQKKEDEKMLIINLAVSRDAGLVATNGAARRTIPPSDRGTVFSID